MKPLFIVLLWGLSFSTLAGNLPASVSIAYSMKSGGITAEVNETLKVTQEKGVRSYVLTSEARANGLLALLHQGSIVRTSQGAITDRGLQPKRFSDQRGEKQPAVAIFDWGKKLLTLQHKGSEQQKLLPDNTQDRLSLFYTFAFSPPVGETVEMHETDGRSLSPIRYAVTGKEMLDTPMGKLETMVLVKQQQKDNQRGRKIWLATAHHLLPVRIVATEKDGTTMEQMVTKIVYP